ncbi:MAG: cell division protein SepF [Erysipelotrichaceae bacterium]|jgi:cell division inhibitor SepF|nr:cell division protein SepF [Erysipelotrichaceae bacterium]
MSISKKIKNFVFPDEESEVLEFSEEEAEKLSEYEQPKNPVKTPSSATTMVLFEPRTFEESEEIARHLKARKAAVVNIHRLRPDFSQRCIDFLSGVVFALDGSIQKVGTNVILCTPRTIGVEGEISLDHSEE